jgi:hypothetical protein
VTGLTSYVVSIDFDGDGVAEDRNMTLTDGVKFEYDPANAPTATVDWRGTIAEGNVIYKFRSRQNELIELNLSDAGDADAGTAFSGFPSITVTTTSADVRAETVVNGNTVFQPNPSPTASYTPLPVCTSGQLPLPNNCRCAAGKTVDDDGKCH